MKLPGNIGDILEQAQKFQSDLARVQGELETRVVEASAGGGMVTVKVSGGMIVTAMQIDRSVVDSNDLEMLQDLVTAAVNEGLRKSKEMMKEEMSKLTGGLSIPGIS